MIWPELLRQSLSIHTLHFLYVSVTQFFLVYTLILSWTHLLIYQTKVLNFWLLKISQPCCKLYRKNFCNSSNLVKKIGCYGDSYQRAFPELKQLSRASTTPELLENVRSCRDEVKQKGGLAAGYKVTGLLSHGLTVWHEPS